MDAIESRIREIVNEMIAEIGPSATADPVLLSRQDVYENPNYGINETLLNHLIKDREKNGFPAIYLSERVIKIDKARLNRWLASGGLGAKV